MHFSASPFNAGASLLGLSTETYAPFPFVHVQQRQDPDTTRLYFGKAFVYPLVVAPFVRLFGLNASSRPVTRSSKRAPILIITSQSCIA